MPDVFVTRQVHFSAAHRLYNPTLSDEENDRLFGLCNNPNGHGHNYVIEVTVVGSLDPLTGYVIDLKELKDLCEVEILSKVDHKHLNLDVPFLRDINPTAENLAVRFFEILEPHLQRPNARLHAVKVWETDRNHAEYRGDR